MRGGVWGGAEHATPARFAWAIPGALPVMNEQALRMTALTGLMLGCEIARGLQV